MGMTSRWQKKKARREAKAIADQMTYEANAEFCRKMDGLWLYALHRVFGFGKQRAERLYFAMVEEYINITKRYNGTLDDDDMEWYAIERYLLDHGIDIKALQDEADRRYPNGAKAEVKKDAW